mmetsp:Transcript_75520/g.179391  ORF Transcript_75520/g.179391 Transcript_75520/m.179391 type:complete len:209 (-) Transcript_75520:189-815(-)
MKKTMRIATLMEWAACTNLLDCKPSRSSQINAPASSLRCCSQTLSWRILSPAVKPAAAVAEAERTVSAECRLAKRPVTSRLSPWLEPTTSSCKSVFGAFCTRPTTSAGGIATEVPLMQTRCRSMADSTATQPTSASVRNTISMSTHQLSRTRPAKRRKGLSAPLCTCSFCVKWPILLGFLCSGSSPLLLCEALGSIAAPALFGRPGPL